MLLLIVGTGTSQFHKGGKKKIVKTPLTCMAMEGYIAVSLGVCAL